MKESILEHLQNLIRMETTSKNPDELKRVIDYVCDVLDGMVINRYEHNGVPSAVFTFGKTKRPEVLFVGHLDVVPGSKEQFEPKIVGNKLYGRGALDMKGPDAVMIALFEKYLKEGENPSIGLMMTTDEEVGSKNGVQYLLQNEKWSAEFAVIPDGGMGFNIITEGKGVLHVKLIAEGKSTHGSTPWLGVNPIDKLIEIYNTLKSKTQSEPCGDPAHWHDTLNLGFISGGDAPNRVPDRAEMSLDFRFTAPKTVDQVLNEIKKTVDKFDGVKLEVLASGGTVYTPPDNPYLQKFKAVSERILNREVKFSREHGATDGRFFTDAGIPVLVTYPIGDGIHGENEWVDINSLETLYRIFDGFVRSL